MSDRKPFLLRLDPALFDALQRWANDEFRSLNGQIEFLLTRALNDAGRPRGGASPGRGGDKTGRRRRRVDEGADPGSDT
ncbi:MAG: hypothetical protein EHM24_25155 [Acidobacteria bacterium]|nr:MAG: hypothetical protein EHM24_25155 [Acidobacteriota bacterium]